MGTRRADIDPERDRGARFQVYKWALGLTAALVQSAIYFGVGRLDLGRSPALLETALDRAIPLVPFTVWCYLPFYAGIFALAIAGFRSRALFHRALWGVVGTMLAGAAGHVLIAAEYPRPALPSPSPDISTAFLAWVYTIDPPGNVFPSLHVAHTSALSVVLVRDRPILGRVTVVMALLLAGSTLTTKQHFVADVIAGFAMAAVCATLVLRDHRTPTSQARAEAA